MRPVHSFLVARLKNNGASISIWLIIGGILTACGTYSVPSLPDGAPVKNAIEYPVEQYKNLSLEKLRSIGIEQQVIDMGEKEYGIYVARNNRIGKAIADGKIHINFSLWDAKGNFVLAMPAIADNAAPFVVAEGYQLRIALVIATLSQVAAISQH